MIDGDADAHFDAVPARLVDGRGAQFGVYASVPQESDLRPLASGLVASMRFKAWHHLLIHSPSLSMTVAMVDLGCLKTAWVRWIPADGELGVEPKEPLERLRGPNRLRRTVSSFRARRFDLELAHHTPRHPGSGSTARSFPLSLTSMDAPWPAGGLSADRCASAPLQPKDAAGVRGVGPACGETFDLSDGVAMIDVHQAYYPHRTTWRWATADGAASTACSAALT